MSGWNILERIVVLFIIFITPNRSSVFWHLLHEYNDVIHRCIMANQYYLDKAVTHLSCRLRGQNTFIRDIILLQKSSNVGATRRLLDGLVFWLQGVQWRIS